MRAILFFLCTLLCSQADAQIVQNSYSKSVKIDQRQVSNQDWQTFMEFMKNDPSFSKKDILAMTPDQWSAEKLGSKNKDQAVTGVSWQQATRYCKWRSELLTYMNTHIKATTYQKMLTDNKLAKTYISYRLPTGDEYTKLMRNSRENAKGDIGFRGVYMTKNSTVKSLDI